MNATEWNQRVVDLVCAPGSIVKNSGVNGGWIVVVDGRTGLDACQRTARECFDAIFAEADGGESPARLNLVVAPSPEGGP